MKTLRQLALLLLLCFISEILSKLLPFTFPSGVIGMLLLLILLLTKIIPVDSVEDVCSFLTKNLSLFFLPATVQIVEQFDVIRDHLLPIIIIIMVSTILTFAVTAGMVSLCMKVQNKIRGKKNAA